MGRGFRHSGGRATTAILEQRVGRHGHSTTAAAGVQYATRVGLQFPFRQETVRAEEHPALP